MAISSDKFSLLAELFHSGLKGNHADYACFLKSIIPLLKRMVGGQLPASDVDDVVQEILISVHKARHTYDGQRPFRPWLSAIAKFRISDHLRGYYAQHQDKTEDINAWEDILPDVTESTAHYESIYELLEGVPQAQKKILTLLYAEGHTAKEVGVLLGMNESAVKVAAHRAIKKIREQFKE
jgi:RNA polymerase sigma-70 factor, ECF subfamily